jgi:hypothetical protein
MTTGGSVAARAGPGLSDRKQFRGIDLRRIGVSDRRKGRLLGGCFAPTLPWLPGDDGEQVSTTVGTARLCSRTDNPVGSPLCVPIAVAADNGNLYVVDVKNDLHRIDLATGAATRIAGTHRCGSTDGPADLASFCTPQGIAIDRATGVLYVADTNN